jgi:peptide/nickel transport system permease protein
LRLGVLLGLHAGYWGGRADTVVMRLTDILMAFPYILLAIAIVAGLGPGLANAMVAIAIVGFPLYARLVRGLVLSLREREFVEAARALGGTDRLMWCCRSTCSATRSKITWIRGCSTAEGRPPGTGVG